MVNDNPKIIDVTIDSEDDNYNSISERALKEVTENARSLIDCDDAQQRATMLAKMRDEFIQRRINSSQKGEEVTLTLLGALMNRIPEMRNHELFKALELIKSSNMEDLYLMMTGNRVNLDAQGRPRVGSSQGGGMSLVQNIFAGSQPQAPAEADPYHAKDVKQSPSIASSDAEVSKSVKTINKLMNAIEIIANKVDDSNKTDKDSEGK